MKRVFQIYLLTHYFLDKKEFTVLPSIQRKSGVAFDVLLNDRKNSNGSSKLVLPKIGPKKSNETLEREKEEMIERIAEKDAQAKRNRESEQEKRDERNAAKEERARMVIERKNHNESSKESVEDEQEVEQD